MMSRKSRRSRGTGGGSDTESDDGPPPDPDEAPPVVAAPKKDKKTVDAKEVQVSVRRFGDDKSLQGGMSAARRELLLAMRTEEEEPWQPVEFCDGEVLFDLAFQPSLFGLTTLHRRRSLTRCLSLCSRDTKNILNVKQRSLRI
jgi:hypothetical protein